MTKKIFEELPARKNAPAVVPIAAKGANSGGAEGSEKKIRQAVYDIRYRARREGVDLRAAYAQYMQNSNLSAPEQSAVRSKLFSGDGGGEKKESYTPLMTNGATTSIANAMFKVFVEDSEEQEFVYEDESAERKYKVRVTDEKTGRTYVRYADRTKITALREKGLKVEMTEHGEPVGERSRKSGMDPVAKNPSARDGDVNNDGEKNKTDKYIYNRRDAINAAIAKKKSMSEDFLVDGTTSTEGQNKGKITGKSVDNYSTGIVEVMPENSADPNPKVRKGIYAHTEVEMTASQRRLMEMIAEKKKLDSCVHNGKGEECSVHGTKECPDSVSEGMGGDCGPEDKEKKDMRADKTYREVLKNKLRSMGRRVLATTGDDSEKSYEKMATASFIKIDKMTGKMEPVSLYGEAMIMVTDSLIEEGYSEDQIFDAIDNLNENQRQELEEGLGTLINLGQKVIRRIPGSKNLVRKGAEVVKNVITRGGKSKIPAGDIGALRLYQDKANQSLQRLNKSTAASKVNDATRAATREKTRLNNLDPRAVSDRNAREAAAQAMQRNVEKGRPSFAGPQPVDRLDYKPGDPQFTDALKRYYADLRAGVKGLPK